jgi:hypothetical protein
MESIIMCQPQSGWRAMNLQEPRPWPDCRREAPVKSSEQMLMPSIIWYWLSWCFLNTLSCHWLVKLSHVRYIASSV